MQDIVEGVVTLAEGGVVYDGHGRRFITEVRELPGHDQIVRIETDTRSLADYGLAHYGLADGHISIVSPLTAVCSAGLPLAVGLIQGERPGVMSLVGVGLALVAVAMISVEDGHGSSSWSSRRSVTVGLLAGVGFGLFFVILDAVDGGTGLWPVVVSRVAGVPLYLVVWSRSGDPGLTPLPLLAVGAGLLDSAANVSYLLATREGLLSLVAVVASLYPAGTVFLARVVLGERLGPQRLAGVVTALVAVALIAI